MKKLILNLLMISSILFLFNSCNKDDNTDDTTDYSKEKGEFKDSRDGKIYKWVKIGTQIWMSENLAFKVDAGGWAYNEDESNVDKYGYLYDWNTAGTIIPEGWHLPSDEEWTEMEGYLITNGYSYDGVVGNINIAKSLATDYGWGISDVIGAVGNSDYPEIRNKTGFSAMPGGSRNVDGNFDTTRFCSDWWSSTEYDNGEVICRRLLYKNAFITSANTSKHNGFAIRCIKD